MNVRAKNEYFATVFTRELARWKKECGSSQEKFAAQIGVEPNMIGRYKKGEAHPSSGTLERICAVLGVENTIFYPSTLEDRYVYDDDFREVFNRGLKQVKYSTLKEEQIDLAFWGFLWRLIPYTESLIPMFRSESACNPLFFEESGEDLIPVYPKDLEYVRDLQSDVIEYITLHLLKSSLHQRLKRVRMADLTEAEIHKAMDGVFSALTLEILRENLKEEP